MTGAASSTTSITRAEKWWASKIAPLLAAAYLALLISPRPVDEAAGRLVLLVVTACFLATTAYVVNDWFDRESDRALGKESRTGRLGAPVVGVLLVVLWAAGIVPWVIAGLAAPAWAALAAITVVPLVYSAPPIRWKERGALGLVADATLAHLAPTVFALASFDALGPSAAGTAGRVAAGAAILWSLTAGLRMIIGHELVDAPNDRAAGLTTWVIDVGDDRAALVARVVLAVEVVALTALAGSLWWVATPAAIATAVVVAALGLTRLTGAWTQPLTATPVGDDGRAVLFPFYRFWPPLLLLVGLVAADRRYLLVAAAHLALFWTVTVEEVVGLATFAREHLVIGLGRWLRYQAWPWLTRGLPSWFRNRVWGGITKDLPNWFRHRFWPWLTRGVPNWFRYRLRPWVTATVPNWFRYRLPEHRRRLTARPRRVLARLRARAAVVPGRLRRPDGRSSDRSDDPARAGNVPPTDEGGGAARGTR